MVCECGGGDSSSLVAAVAWQRLLTWLKPSSARRLRDAGERRQPPRSGRPSAAAASSMDARHTTPRAWPEETCRQRCQGGEDVCEGGGGGRGSMRGGGHGEEREKGMGKRARKREREREGQPVTMSGGRGDEIEPKAHLPASHDGRAAAARSRGRRDRQEPLREQRRVQQGPRGRVHTRRWACRGQMRGEGGGGEGGGGQGPMPPTKQLRARRRWRATGASSCRRCRSGLRGTTPGAGKGGEGGEGARTAGAAASP